MNTKLIQLQQRIKYLDELAEEVYKLAEELSDGQNPQPKLAQKGQAWYRGCRELMVQNNFSGLEEFDSCYNSQIEHAREGHKYQRSFTDIEQYIVIGLDYKAEKEIKPVVMSESDVRKNKEYFGLFSKYFRTARVLSSSLVEEIISRELPIISQLSFEVAADEFETAEILLKNSKGDEAFVRASGVISRVALERHLLTVIDSRGLQIILNPPTKKKPTSDDLLVTLNKNTVITAIQKKEMESLFTIGNNCAHPKEQVKVDDVKKLIEGGRSIAAIIL